MPDEQNVDTNGTAMALACAEPLKLCVRRKVSGRQTALPIICSAVRTSVQYVPAPGTEFSYAKVHAPKGSHHATTNFAKDCRAVEVQDARLAAQPFQLHEHGFTLAELGVPVVDWGNAEEVCAPCFLQNELLKAEATSTKQTCTSLQPSDLCSAPASQLAY